MNFFAFILVLLWWTRILANLLSYIHLWFVKEYRFDRMWIHLHTRQGKLLLFLPFRKPPISPKSVVIFVGTSMVLGFLFVLLPFSVFFRLLVLDVLTFPITALFVLLTRIPTLLYHHIQIARAVRILSAHPPMTVIGITGSFGKTSTKEFLSAILETKYSVIRTEGTKNSPIAIAETIIKYLRPEHEVLVVEMGAYKRGEIAQMCEMVKPEIGIVTAINPQHLDLFGSIETTMLAKYELVEGLRGKQIAIFNADNEKTNEMIKWAKRDKKAVWRYTKNVSQNDGNDIFSASEIRANDTGLQFVISWRNEKKTVSVPLLGAHQVSTILASVAGAVAAGMSFAQAASATSQIKSLPKILQSSSGPNGSTFIDDTSNNNPDAACAALDVLAFGKYKKYLVFQPMIELGAYAASSHESVGEYAGKICDEIFLTNGNYFDSFSDGVHTVKPNLIIRVADARVIAQTLKKEVGNGDFVLFKGKEAGRALALLTREI